MLNYEIFSEGATECLAFFWRILSPESVSIIIIVSSITAFAGVLFVHQPSANHAPGASVTQVNHSVHTLTTFLRIRADPSMQIFWITVTVALSDTFLMFFYHALLHCTKRTNNHRDHNGFHMPHSLLLLLLLLLLLSNKLVITDASIIENFLIYLRPPNILIYQYQ